MSVTGRVIVGVASGGTPVWRGCPGALWRVRAPAICPWHCRPSAVESKPPDPFAAPLFVYASSLRPCAEFLGLQQHILKNREEKNVIYFIYKKKVVWLNVHS